MAESASFARKFWQQVGALIGVVASLAGIAGFYLSLQDESSTPTASGAEIAQLREMNEHLAVIRENLSTSEPVLRSVTPEVRDVIPPTPQQDDDADGVADARDLCPLTPTRAAVVLNGCSADEVAGELPALDGNDAIGIYHPRWNAEAEATAWSIKRALDEHYANVSVFSIRDRGPMSWVRQEAPDPPQTSRVFVGSQTDVTLVNWAFKAIAGLPAGEDALVAAPPLELDGVSWSGIVLDKRIYIIAGTR